MKTTGLRLDDLRTALERLLSAIEEQIGTEIEMPVDYYWCVATDERFELSAEPRPGLGSAFDDVESVVEFATADADEPKFIWHECEHLAGVLLGIAQIDLL